MEYEKLPRKNMTIRERKIWGYSGLLFYLGGFLIICFGAFESSVIERYGLWLTGLTSSLIGLFAVMVSLIEKIWRYIAQNTDLRTDE